MQLNVDAAIFIGFLGINLIVGLYCGKGVKTIKDYALGGRNFSTVALVSTIVATTVTGSSFFIILSQTYSNGSPFMIASASQAISIIVTALFIVPRMGEFMGSLSIAEVMGNLYGKTARLITAVSGILWCTGSIAVQFKVFGSLFNYFLGIPPNLAIVVAAVIVILYSSFGGIKAVTYTDILQFFTFGLIVPIITILIWNEFQSQGFNIDAILANPKFNYQSISSLNKPQLVSFILLILYFSIPGLGPTDFQRISMGSNIKQVKRAFLIAAILCIVIELTVAWIPVILSTLNPNIEPTHITSYIINNYTYTGLKGLIIVGVSAMTMSSADSFINSSSILFGYDLKEVFNLKISHLVLSKIFAVALGCFGVYLAISTNDLLSMIMTTASFYMPVVTVPLVVSMIGFRTSNICVLIAMLSGFITVILSMLFKIDDIIIPAMLINALFLFGSHYLLKQPGGWVGIKDDSHLIEARQERKKKIARFVKSLTVSNFITFCKQTAPKDEMMYSWLGIYLIVFTISTMYSTQVALLRENGKIILCIYQIMICTGVITAMYPIWPSKIKNELIMQVAWNIIIFYMLVFFSCFFAMLSGFGQLQFAIFTVNIIITAILVGWKLSFIMIPVGFYLSVMFYKYYAGIDSLNLSIGSPSFIFMYTLMLIGSSLIIFLKPKQEYQLLTEAKNTHLTQRIKDAHKELANALNIKGEFLRNAQHEYNAPLSGIIGISQALSEHYYSFNDELKQQVIKTIYESAIRLDNYTSNLAILSKLSKKPYKFSRKKFDLSDLVNERIETCRNLYDEEAASGARAFNINIQDDIIFNGDKNYLTKAIDNLIINAITYCTKGKITATLSQDKNRIFFFVEDEGIGIPKDELHDIFSEFTVSSKTKSLAGNRGLGLTVCRKIIQAHGGDIKAESNGVKGAKFVVGLPRPSLATRHNP
jgi:Na+/proline symporter/signal transduction histidine kinase